MKKFLTILFILCLVSVGASAEVKHQAKVGKSSTITFACSNILINMQSTTQVEIKATATNCAFSKANWSSANSKIVTVDSTGKLTAKKPGETTVKLSLRSLSGKTISASCKVSVTNGNLRFLKASNSLNLANSETTTLTPVYEGTSVHAVGITYTSSNNRVATVNASGKVTPKSIGRCTITCKDKSNKKITANIEVYEEVVLNVKTREQTTNSCCSGAAAYKL